MPYITQGQRQALKSRPPIKSGELNYAITCLLRDFLKRKGLSYKTLNTIMGVLECSKTEFYRRVVEPYEREKLRDNGDVY